MMDIIGEIHAIGETQQVTDKFTKRAFVLVTKDNPRYPQFCEFELTGDRCDMLDPFRIGEEVRVEFSLRGRAWEPTDGRPTKYFNTLSVWNIVLMQSFAAAPTPPPPAGMEDDIGF